MLKSGKQFEEVVRDLVHQIDADSSVQQGTWIMGPDGHRELDVLIDTIVDGHPRRIQIECKDYNPRKRPIGLATIDALESKHRDLGINHSFICSNAGFTAEAKRKAKRVGIGLIGITKSSDNRIKYTVTDDIYIRRIDVIENSVSVTITAPHPVIEMQNADLSDLFFGKWLVLEWIKHRIMLDLYTNPIVSGTHILNLEFKVHPYFTVYGVPFAVSKVQIMYSIKGAWFRQRIIIDSTKGFYDWIRQAVVHGPNSVQITYGNIEIGKGGIWVSAPFDDKSVPEDPYNLARTSMKIIDIGGIEKLGEVPPIDEFLSAENHLLPRDNIPMSAGVSDSL